MSWALGHVSLELALTWVVSLPICLKTGSPHSRFKWGIYESDRSKNEINLVR